MDRAALDPQPQVPVEREARLAVVRGGHVAVVVVHVRPPRVGLARTQRRARRPAGRRRCRADRSRDGSARGARRHRSACDGGDPSARPDTRGRRQGSPGPRATRSSSATSSRAPSSPARTGGAQGPRCPLGRSGTSPRRDRGSSRRRSGRAGAARTATRLRRRGHEARGLAVRQEAVLGDQREDRLEVLGQRRTEDARAAVALGPPVQVQPRRRQARHRSTTVAMARRSTRAPSSVACARATSSTRTGPSSPSAITAQPAAGGIRSLKRAPAGSVAVASVP